MSYNSKNDMLMCFVLITYISWIRYIKHECIPAYIPFRFLFEIYGQSCIRKNEPMRHGQTILRRRVLCSRKGLSTLWRILYTCDNKRKVPKLINPLTFRWSLSRKTNKNDSYTFCLITKFSISTKPLKRVSDYF